MSDVAIKVAGLGKKYTLRHSGGRQFLTLRDTMVQYAQRAGKMLLGKRQKNRTAVEPFWAVKDVSFEVSRGDRVGIIGRNGAGKSTLLKLLSRITEPTTGRIEITGRVASLLEVGTGFHPELSGRENIFLNGAILGMTRTEIRSKFDEIVAFAENEKFLDTPVKRYSSGMYVRLAFAVAAHLEPEILIVDEVLAVGDLEFQKKCLGKMQDVSTKEGRTVLFVSHNMAAVQALCTHGIWMDRGTSKMSGPANEVVQAYTKIGGSGDLSHATAASKYFKLLKVRASTPDGSLLMPFQPAEFEIVYKPLFNSVDVGANLLIEDINGAPILGLDSRDFFNRKAALAGQLVTIRFNIESLPLTPGPFRVRVLVKSDADSVFWEVPHSYDVTVEEGLVYGTRKLVRKIHGVAAARANVNWEIAENDTPGELLPALAAAPTSRGFV